jgi:hypothetical protein
LYGTTPDDNNQVNTGFWLAQDFIVPAGGVHVTEYIIYGNDAGSESGNIIASIQGNNAGAPNGTDVTGSVKTLGAAVFTGGPKDGVFTLDATIALAAGTYWLVVKGSLADTSIIIYSQGYNTSSHGSSYYTAAWHAYNGVTALKSKIYGCNP